MFTHHQYSFGKCQPLQILHLLVNGLFIVSLFKSFFIINSLQITGCIIESLRHIAPYFDKVKITKERGVDVQKLGPTACSSI